MKKEDFFKIMGFRINDAGKITVQNPPKFTIDDTVKTPHGPGVVNGFHRQTLTDVYYMVTLYYKSRTKDKRFRTVSGFEVKQISQTYHQKFLTKL